MEGDLSTTHTPAPAFSPSEMAFATVTDLFISRIEEGAVDIPLFPPLVSAILLKLSDPTATFTDLAPLVAQDPVLVAELLRVANSILYKGQVPAYSIMAALSRVGTRGLRETMLTLTASRLHKVPGHGSLTLRLQVRSQAVALAATRIASAVHQDREKAFMAGLLHDVGWALIYSLYGACRRNLPQEFLQSTSTRERFAEEMHTALGERLAKNWNLGNDITAVIAHHHHPENDKSGSVFVPIVHAAIRMVDQMGIYARPVGSAEVTGAANRLGVDASSWERLRKDVELTLDAIGTSGR